MNVLHTVQLDVRTADRKADWTFIISETDR